MPSPGDLSLPWWPQCVCGLLSRPIHLQLCFPLACDWGRRPRNYIAEIPPTQQLPGAIPGPVIRIQPPQHRPSLWTRYLCEPHIVKQRDTKRLWNQTLGLRF